MKLEDKNNNKIFFYSFFKGIRTKKVFLISLALILIIALLITIFYLDFKQLSYSSKTTDVLKGPTKINGKWIVEGTVSDFNSSSIQLTTEKGILDFAITNNVPVDIVERYKPSSKIGIFPGQPPYLDIQSLIKALKQGNYLKIEYDIDSNSVNKATKIYYK